ncbi:MAG: hypothetical protein QXF35_00735 [Candidatus Bilamarchaeaceae archaeon]
MNFPNIYNIKGYRILAIPPLILLLVAILYIPHIKLGVEFNGGTLLSLDLEEKMVDTSVLKNTLIANGLQGNVKMYDTPVGQRVEIELPQSDTLIKAEKLRAEFDKNLASASTLEVEAEQNSTKKAEYEKKYSECEEIVKDMYSLAGMEYQPSEKKSVNELDKKISLAYKEIYSNYEKSIVGPINKVVKYKSMSIKTISPILSASFIDTAIKVALVAAVLSSVFIFAYFRAVVPSIAVLVGATCDIVIALGAMGFFGIPLTLASFAALLMLVGFSLDTDILLTMRMLKQKGSPREHAYDAMKTGLTMSTMALVSFGILFILANITHISTYYEIAGVALAGLVGDMFATWGINAVMLLYYLEQRRG